MAVRFVTLGVLLSSPVIAPLRAQSAQPYSVQATGLVTTVPSTGGPIRGIGVEPQLRFNRALTSEKLGAVSLGVGAQFSRHTGTDETVRLAALFVEPRWALPFSVECAFPYLAARAGMLRISSDVANGSPATATGYLLGAGPGVMFRATRHVNIDVGGQLVYHAVGAPERTGNGRRASYALRMGLTVGLPD